MIDKWGSSIEFLAERPRGLPGSLQREPDNAFDENAVAVMVEGERVGYLAGPPCTGISRPSRRASAPL